MIRVKVLVFVVHHHGPNGLHVRQHVALEFRCEPGHSLNTPEEKNAHILASVCCNRDFNNVCLSLNVNHFVFATVEKEKCMKPECSATDIEIPDAMCPVTLWSDWSPCSQTCGNGIRIRTRLLLVEDAMKDECSKRLELHQQEQCIQKESCVFNQQEAEG